MSETFYIKKTAFNDIGVGSPPVVDIEQSELNSFIVGPGELNGPGGLNRDSDLELYGFGALKWGEGVDQNQYRQLENFACPQKETGDYWAAGSPPENAYNSTIHPVTPKDENDLGLGNGITTPLMGQGWYNTSVNHSYELKVSGWIEIISNDGVVLNDNLDMNGSVVVNSGAVTGASSSTTLTTKQYVDDGMSTHAADLTLHITANQNTFLDGLNLPTLQSTEVNQLEGASSNIQAQLDALSIGIDTAITNALDALHPVGSVYYTKSPTMPTILTDIGTWVQTARGRTIIGEGSSDQVFSAASTGGESNHELSIGAMPSHNHGGGNHGHSGTIITSAVQVFNSWDNKSFYEVRGIGGIGSSGTIINAEGSNQTHNNLQPYLVTYIFERIA